MTGGLQQTGGMGSTGRGAVGGYGGSNGTNFGTGPNTNSFVPSVGPSNNNYQPIGAGQPAGAGLGDEFVGRSGHGLRLWFSPVTLRSRTVAAAFTGQRWGFGFAAEWWSAGASLSESLNRNLASHKARGNQSRAFAFSSRLTIRAAA